MTKDSSTLLAWRSSDTVASSWGFTSQAGFALASAAPVVVEDLRTERRFSAAPFFRDHDVVSGASVVILSPGDERPYGVLCAHTKTRRAFGANETALMQAVGVVGWRPFLTVGMTVYGADGWIRLQAEVRRAPLDRALRTAGFEPHERADWPNQRLYNPSGVAPNWKLLER